MKNAKMQILLLFFCSITILLSSCTKDNSYDMNKKSTTTVAETEEENISETPLDPKYAQVRFGATKDILLLDIEWHTYDSYKEMVSEYYSEIPEWLNEQLEAVKNKEIYMSKTINGKNASSISSSNPYNNDWNWDEKDVSQIDPDGYYIYNIYPFPMAVYYIDDNEGYHYKYFYDDNDISIYNEKEFYFIADDLISYCDELLAEGKITREMYEGFAIKSPLDYYTRVSGWFGEEGIPDEPLPDIPPVPDIIKDKDDFSILYIGNSLTFSGDVPKQVSKLSEMYGITVTYDTVFEGGAKLSDIMEQAMEKIQNEDNHYDYIVFQDYGTRPISERLNFISDVELLCKEARKVGAIPVFYNPAWSNTEDAKPYKEYQVLLTGAYERAAKTNGGIIINAAEAWVYAYDKHPDLKLYADDVHANNAGAYLTASMFASTLFNLHIKDVTEDKHISWRRCHSTWASGMGICNILQ